MIETLTPPIRNLVEKSQRLLSTHFQTPLAIQNVSQLSEPDRRNLILRLYIHSPNDQIPQSVIVKKTTIEPQGETEQEQMSRFARDWAGLEFLTNIGPHHAPRFYSGDIAHQFIIIEDLGEPHHSLVGPLTRPPSPDNIKSAIQALEIYSRRLGQMHADTFGKTNEFNKILQRIYPQAIRIHFLKEQDITDVLACFKRHAGLDSLALRLELEDIHNVLSTDDYRVLLHGDICPDNVYFQKSDMQIIDFEYGDLGPALVDGVYLRMSMPSCWCAKTVPTEIVRQMESIYRNELKAKILSAHNNQHYNKMLVYACAYWAIRTILWHLERVMEQDIICHSGPVDNDSAWKPEENAFRSKVIARLEAFCSIAKRHQHLPELTHAVLKLLDNLKSKWQVKDRADNFPVFL